MSLSSRAVARAVALATGLLGAAAGAAPADAVLFVSNRSGNAQIHVMRSDGSGERALTQGPHENTEPAWSPDGRRIAFTSYRDGNAEIYVMEADGANPRRLTSEPLADNAPAWTPDGRIVFRSMRSRRANFYAMDASGANLVALTDSELDKGQPVVSPDGRWIAFVGHEPRGGADIHLMPARGGVAKNLTGALSKNQKSYPSWSPDSMRLAYVESSGQALNVRSIGVDGSAPVALTDNGFTNAFPQWSPDGRRVVFVSGREGSRSELARGDVHVMNADGSGTVNLTRHPDEDNYPAWSADGASILFVSLRDGRAQIYAVPAGGGPARRLTHHDGHDVMIRPFMAATPTSPALAQAARAQVPGSP